MNIDFNGFENEQNKDLLVVVLDNQGRIIFINKAMEQFTGRSFKELKELKAWDLFSIEDESNLIREHFTSFNNELFPRKLKGRVVTKEGSGKDVKWSNNVLLNRDDQIDRVICFGKILTENDEYEYEDTFTRDINKEQPLKPSLKNCFLITNEKGKILDISDSYCELTGYSRQELLRMTLHEMDGNTNSSELHIKIQKTVNKGHNDFQFIQRLCNGELLNLQINANYSHNFGGLVFLSINNNSRETETLPPVDQNKPEFRQYLRAQILDKIEELIFIHDFSGNLIYVNEIACKSFGYPKKELFEIKFNDLFFPHDSETYESLLKQVIDEDEVCIETKYNRKDDNQVDVYLRSQIMSVSNRKLILTVVKENNKITDSNNDIKKFIDIINIPLIMMNEDTTIVNCNDLFCSLCGYEKDEIMTTSFEDLLVNGNSGKLKTYLDNVKKGNPQHLLALLKNKNGKRINIEIASKFISNQTNIFSTMVHDVTKQKVLADGYKNSLQINKLLSTNTDNIVYRVFTNPKLKLEYISDSVQNILGYEPQEFYENPELISKLCHPEDKKYMESILHKCDETSSKVRLIHKDGSAVLLEIEHESIYDTTKKFVGYEGSARDITLIDEMKTELDDRSRYMNTITGSLKAGVVIISRDHSIVWLNDIARELFPAHANKKCYKALYSSGQTCDSCIFKDNIKYKDEKRLIKIDNQNNENLYPEYEVLTFPMNKDNGKVDEIIELFMPVKAAKAEKEDVAVNDINLAGKPVNNSPSSSSSSQLCEMNDLLRSCVNTREASRIVSRYLPRLFPNLAGTIFLYKSQVNLFEPAVSWGKYNRNPGAFSPETCTAIRRGKKILVDNEENEEACEHMGQETTLNYAEIPMIFQGEYVGLLHLQNQSQELQNTDRNDEAVNNNIVLLAQVVADQIAVVLTSIKLREAFQEQNKHDPVTGFFNRKYMEQMLEREISLATGSGRQIGVIILSLENFNEFTESRGYQNSDFVLQNFGVLLKNGCSPEDIICRCDGNKFAVVVPNSSADHIKGRAMALHEISKLINIGDKQPSSAPLHLSLGIALHPDHGASAEDVIKSAYSSLQTNRKKLESLKESNLNNIREAVKQR